ncbi:MAG: hypothetical protein KY442_10460 [Proteobacteria bacterium]|nr:hypothetical protein [Pseudomonadota bacterium]
MSRDDEQGSAVATAGHDEQALLATGLLSICKQLLGRVRVLEEALAAHPELAAQLTRQKRFQAAFEEDEFGRATAELRVETTGPARLDLDLTAVPTLDVRTLVPPGNAASWAAWAAGEPNAAERRAALDLLVRVAATGARATSYAPYLGADLPGTGTTVFRYAFAPVEAVAAVRASLEPKPAALALAGVALLLLLANAALLWRAS